MHAVLQYLGEGEKGNSKLGTSAFCLGWVGFAFSLMWIVHRSSQSPSVLTAASLVMVIGMNSTGTLTKLEIEKILCKQMSFLSLST